MIDLVEYIVKQIVTNPEAVRVEEDSQDGNVNLLLHIDPVDFGIVIGKKGQTIKAIRKVLTVRAMADNVRVNLQLVEQPHPQDSGPTEESKTPSQAPVESEALSPEIEPVSESN